jgi:pimeloyl-ACP methyl ester carboxylesterase
MVGGAGMSCNSRRIRPANGSGWRGSTPCRRRLSAGRKLDASLWKGVIASLPPGYRCAAPTLPPGAHRRVMKPSADLSLPGMAPLVGEFLDRFGLADVTLVGNDSGGAITQVLISGGAPWVGRVVLASCEAFGNFPPGRTLALAGKLPPTLFGLVIQQMRVRPLHPLPNAFGWLTKRGDAATA